MKEREQLAIWFNGNQGAVSFCETLGYISQVWDDLIDNPSSVDSKSISKAFLLALTLADNRFYVENALILQPVMKVAMIDWMTSNVISRDLPHVAYTIRDNLASVVITCIEIISGIEMAILMAPDVRRFVHDEPLEDYINGQSRWKQRK